ncbi:hypothetical protein CAC42_1038 [Sphaceloma murrayae]|uniref:Uncharacterized protein n=1 Tax=Sphaceloma murrayae TaxID=2082308 RepID=A0A2K1R1T4_9PEZI|nr:hypothetical protein CAC42_1038 [Sphaceloma murrayae]
MVSALAGLAFAAPRPQEQGIEIDAVEAQGLGVVDGPPLAATVTAEIPTYVPAIAASSAAAEITSAGLKKRVAAVTTSADPSACTPLPKGYGPVSSPDTAASFKSNTNYDQIAAAADVPQGYTLSFSGLRGATEGEGYLGYYTLKSYDTIGCQSYCDRTKGCQGFNVYLERDPIVNPGPNCKNPSSTVLYKCSLWGLPVVPATAKNEGQWRYDFNVLIAGSNGYNSLAPPAPIPGYTGPTKFGGAIQAPLLPSGADSYMGFKYYTGAYNPSLCTSACTAQNIYNEKHPASDGTWKKCIFTNSYVLSKNNSPLGTYCSLYTYSWGNDKATNYGQYRGSDYYSVSQSYGWSMTG